MSVEINDSGASLSAAESADVLADQRIMKQLAVCVLVMMGIAVAILTTANSIA